MGVNKKAALTGKTALLHKSVLIDMIKVRIFATRRMKWDYHFKMLNELRGSLNKSISLLLDIQNM